MPRAPSALENTPTTGGQAPQAPEGHQTPFYSGRLNPPTLLQGGQAAQPEEETEVGTLATALASGEP